MTDYEEIGRKIAKSIEGGRFRAAMPGFLGGIGLSFDVPGRIPTNQVLWLPENAEVIDEDLFIDEMRNILLGEEKE